MWVNPSHRYSSCRSLHRNNTLMIQRTAFDAVYNIEQKLYTKEMHSANYNYSDNTQSRESSVTPYTTATQNRIGLQFDSQESSERTFQDRKTTHFFHLKYHNTTPLNYAVCNNARAIRSSYTINKTEEISNNTRRRIKLKITSPRSFPWKRIFRLSELGVI